MINLAELQKRIEIDLRKIYLRGTATPPPGVSVQTGKRGGKFYNSEDVSPEHKEVMRTKTRLYKRANVTTGWKDHNGGVAHMHFRDGEQPDTSSVTRKPKYNDRKSTGKPDSFHMAGRFHILPTKDGAVLRYEPIGQGKSPRQPVIVATAKGDPSSCQKRLKHEAAYFDGEPDELDKALKTGYKPKEITVEKGARQPSKALADVKKAKSGAEKTLKKVKSKSTLDVMKEIAYGDPAKTEKTAKETTPAKKTPVKKSVEDVESYLADAASRAGGDLSKLLKSESDAAIDYLSTKFTLPQLRKRQDVISAQQQSVYKKYMAAKANDDVSEMEKCNKTMKNLDIMDAQHVAAIDKQQFGTTYHHTGQKPVQKDTKPVEKVTNPKKEPTPKAEITYKTPDGVTHKESVRYKRIKKNPK